LSTGQSRRPKCPSVIAEGRCRFGISVILGCVFVLSLAGGARSEDGAKSQLAAKPDSAPDSAKVYNYSVSHPIYGEIGTYTNIVEDRGAEISVKNSIRVRVKLLFMVAYDEVGDNEEVWRNGRMVSFKGNVRKNGKKWRIKGYAKGDKFIIEGPEGVTEAPGNVFPSNPWSTDILEASVLMGTASGDLYRVRMSLGEERELKIGERSFRTRYVKVGGDRRYELWFDDDSGIPLKFTRYHGDDIITFSLVHGAENGALRVMKGSMGSP
jgi:hypothetical protein